MKILSLLFLFSLVGCSKPIQEKASLPAATLCSEFFKGEGAREGEELKIEKGLYCDGIRGRFDKKVPSYTVRDTFISTRGLTFKVPKSALTWAIPNLR